MNKRLIGLTVGFALVAGIAIGDIAEPAVSAFKDRVMIVLERNGPNAGIHQAWVSVPSYANIEAAPYQWRYDLKDFWGSNPAITFENDPSKGVTVTVHLGSSVPSMFGGGIAEIRTVRVAYGPDQAFEIPRSNLR